MVVGKPKKLNEMSWGLGRIVDEKPEQTPIIVPDSLYQNNGSKIMDCDTSKPSLSDSVKTQERGGLRLPATSDQRKEKTWGFHKTFLTKK